VKLERKVASIELDYGAPPFPEAWIVGG